MTIKEYELYHGAALTKLANAVEGGVRIGNYPSKSNSSYHISDSIGVYIKYSTKRMSPWGFTFLKEHQDEIREIFDQYGEVFVLFVCNDDGVVPLDYQTLKRVLDETHEEMEWVRISRRKGGMYSVGGQDGTLDFKVAKNAYPKLVLRYLETADINDERKSVQENSRFINSLKSLVAKVTRT